MLLDLIRSGDSKKASDEARRHVADWIKLMPSVPATETGDILLDPP
jgi:hypothetical protein